MRTVTPLFDALGHKTLWVGAAGRGTRVKVVNNAWLAFGAEAVDVSVALAHRLGLDTDTMVDALEAGPLVSPWQSAKLQRVVKGDFSPQFALRLALKDVRLALDAADDDRFAALSGLADEWQRAVADGLGDEDLTVVTQALAPGREEHDDMDPRPGERGERNAVPERAADAASSRPRSPRPGPADDAQGTAPRVAVSSDFLIRRRVGHFTRSASWP